MMSFEIATADKLEVRSWSPPNMAKTEEDCRLLLADPIVARFFNFLRSILALIYLSRTDFLFDLIGEGFRMAGISSSTTLACSPRLRTRGLEVFP